MPRDTTAVLDDVAQGVTLPIRAYNLLQEQERVVLPEKNPGLDDPELRKRIQFTGGNYLVRTMEEYAALVTKEGVVFEDFPPGAPDRSCPRCGKPFRNDVAFDAHIVSHMN